MPVLRIRGLVGGSGAMSGVDGVDLDVRAGEVMGLVGGSGAGKSALVDLVAGVRRPDAGEVLIAGNPVLRPEFARVVRVIRQPSDVALDLTVAENVCVGALPRNRFRLVSRRRMARLATQALGRLGVHLDPGQPVRRLSPASQCAVQAAGALVSGVRIVAFDGLSSVMPASEIRQVLPLMARLAEAGMAVLYTSRCVHGMYDVCDRITVLRNGRVSATFTVDDMNPARVVDSVLDAGTAKTFARRREHVRDEPVLEVRGLASGTDVRDVSFSVSSGETVALIGAGRTEVGKALFGAAPVSRGEILLHGERLRLRTPRDAVRAGIGYLSEAQEVSGLLPGQSVGDNLGMLAPYLTWSRSARQRLVRQAHTLLGIECPSPDAAVDRLPVGEQRKLGLAKWLAAESEVLVLDEPGGAVDARDRAEIRWMIRELAAAGVAVVVISSDLADVLDLADRVVVLGNGRTAGSLLASEATEDDVANLVTGRCMVGGAA